MSKQRDAYGKVQPKYREAQRWANRTERGAPRESALTHVSWVPVELPSGPRVSLVKDIWCTDNWSITTGEYYGNFDIRAVSRADAERKIARRKRERPDWWGRCRIEIIGYCPMDGRV